MPQNISLDKLCPYIRKAGVQTQVSWKNHSRRIFDHELLFCRKGRAKMKIEDRVYQMTPGTIVCIPPDTPHNFWMEEMEGADIYWVHFDFVYRDDVYLLESLLSRTHEVLYEPKLPRQDFIRSSAVLDNDFVFSEFLKFEQPVYMEELFLKLIFHYNLQDDLWQIECRIILLEILKNILYQTRKKKEYQASCTCDAVKTVAQYLYKHYERKITLEELAHIAGFSEDHLGKLFKRETGLTIIQFIHKLRIAKAKQLLWHSDFSIESIAQSTGFGDVFYLGRLMKRYEGITPAQWRKKRRVIR